MSASSVVAGQKPSSAANSRSLSVSIVIGCVGGRPRTVRCSGLTTRTSRHLGSTLGLNLTLTRKFGQVCPPFGGVAIGLLVGGVGAVPGDGIVIEIRRIPAQLGGQFSTQTLVSLAARHYSSS
jgi:hypothetical protein